MCNAIEASSRLGVRVQGCPLTYDHLLRPIFHKLYYNEYHVAYDIMPTSYMSGYMSGVPNLPDGDGVGDATMCTSVVFNALKRYI